MSDEFQMLIGIFIGWCIAPAIAWLIFLVFSKLKDRLSHRKNDYNDDYY